MHTRELDHHVIGRAGRSAVKVPTRADAKNVATDKIGSLSTSASTYAQEFGGYQQEDHSRIGPCTSFRLTVCSMSRLQSPHTSLQKLLLGVVIRTQQLSSDGPLMASPSYRDRSAYSSREVSETNYIVLTQRSSAHRAFVAALKLSVNHLPSTNDVQIQRIGLYAHFTTRA